MEYKSYKLISILFLCLLITPAKAQKYKKVEIRGTIIEKSTSEPIESATVRLLSNQDSTLKSGAATLSNGSFALKNISPGTYILHISYIGYENLYQPVKITGNRETVNVGKLELEENSVLLGEAVATAKAIEVNVKEDTVEYNADSYKVQEGSMLEDLLKKMPGVEVGSDGKVTVNGKEIKKILVDGKEFFSDDPKVASKNLPAKMIDKVQTYDKKSDMAMMTGFDDGDEEAVINLTVKPGMKQGWFGSAMGGGGAPLDKSNKDGKYEGNVAVNRFINNDQFSLIGGINNTNNMGFTDFAASAFQGMGGGGRRGMGGGGAGNGITESANLGMNFNKELSKKFTINGFAAYSRSDNHAESNSQTENILPTGNTFDKDTAISNTLNNNIMTRLRLTWKPDSLTQFILKPMVRYSKTKQDENAGSYTFDANRDSVNSVYERSNSDGNNLNTGGELEFSRKLNSRGRVLSASVSGNYSSTDNDANNYSLTNYYKSGDPATLIDQKTNYDNTSYNYRGFLSWVEPVGHNNFIQLTYNYSHNKREALKNAYSNDGLGNYNTLDSTYSKSSRNWATEQRASVAFKAQREKYNYTIGFNIDPSYAKTETFVGNTVLASYDRNVVNFSPTFQLNYHPSRQKNLRIDYDGRTSQPSMTQLSPVADVSDPLNITIGNPDLKPIYTNNLRLRFQNFNQERQSALMFMANGGYVVNDIVRYSEYDKNTGRQTTTYRNVNGNYNANARFMFNTPLRNKKFSVSNMTFGSFANTNSYISIGKNDAQKNTNKSLRISDRPMINFRSDYLDLGLNGNFSYQRTRNSLEGQTDLNTYDYGGGAFTTIYFPNNFRIESDINYTTNSGYTDGYKKNEWLWNAALSKSFLKGNQATLKIKFYDILQQRSNVSYTASSSATKYSEFNTINSYFIIHFIYRFSIFKGGATMSDMRRGGPGRPGGRPPM